MRLRLTGKLQDFSSRAAAATQNHHHYGAIEARSDMNVNDPAGFETT
jgi:hypothetical protein